MKKYALLVGINSYQSADINNLGGCTNDVAYLAKHLDASFDIKKLEDAEATRQNIIDSFRNHLGKAQEGELALFYFSGHGSMELSPAEFMPYQTDNSHETIVCHDSDRMVDGQAIYDIADKEWKVLLNELTAKGIEIVVIFDCCHSGSGTRDFEFKGIREAVRAKNNTSQRPKAAFLPGTFDLLDTKPKHLFMAACGPREKAREALLLDDELAGVFTYSLIEGLKQAGAAISYTNLAYYCRQHIKVALSNATQTPNLSITGDFDAEATFLEVNKYPQGRAVKIIQANSHGHWTIPIGAVHGLLLDEKNKPQFKIYQDRALSQLVCTATTSEIHLAESTLIESTLVEKLKTEAIEQLMPTLDQNEVYYCVASYLPVEKLAIYISGISDLVSLDEQLAADLKEAIKYTLALTTEQKLPSLYEVAVSKEAYYLLYKETKAPILPFPIPKSIPSNNGQIVTGWTILTQLLLRIAKWEQLKNLKIDKSDIFKRDQDKVTLAFSTGTVIWEPINDRVTVDFNPEFSLDSSGVLIGDSLQQIPFHVDLSNNATAGFYCYPFYLSRNYETVLLNDYKIPASGDPKLIDEQALHIPLYKKESAHLKQVTDTYMILLSKESLPYLNLGLRNSLSAYYKELIANVRYRDRVIIKRKYFNQWFTKKLRIKTLKELGRITTQPLLIANNQITFEAHPSFTATVGIASSAAYMRGPLTDQIIQQKLELVGFDLVDFSSFQLADFGTQQFKNKETILEIHHINNKNSLKTQPLLLHLTLDLPENVQLLALTLPPSMDGQERQHSPGTFPILGQLKNSSDGRFTLSLSKIPANPGDGRAVPDQSLKISFVKVPATDIDTINQWVVKDANGQDWLKLE